MASGQSGITETQQCSAKKAPWEVLPCISSIPLHHRFNCHFCSFNFEQVNLVGRADARRADGNLCLLWKNGSVKQNNSTSPWTSSEHADLQNKGKGFSTPAGTKGRRSLRRFNYFISSFDLKYSHFFRRDCVALSPAPSAHNWGLWIWQSQSLSTDS